jgi:sulfite reductase alpha subunit-like flavoprotein
MEDYIFLSSGEGLSTQYFKMSTKSESDENQQVEDKILEEVGPLGNVRYSVFGLGSRAYPNFCAFAHYIDNMMNSLGGERIYKMGEGDELCGQEEGFRNWARDVFKVKHAFAKQMLEHVYLYLIVVKYCICSRHEITEILLKVALSTISLSQKTCIPFTLNLHLHIFMS